MNPLERLEAARAAWREAEAKVAAYLESFKCGRVSDYCGELDAYEATADAAHNAYLEALEETRVRLCSFVPRGACPHCYGTGADPGGDSGLEFTWRCEACDGDGIQRPKRLVRGEE